jgi:ribosomal-protein-alanine N-acetyltransferase
MLTPAAMSHEPRSDVPDLDALDLVVRAPRLVLRPIAERDADELFAYTSDPELPRLMSWAAHRSREDTLGFARWAAEALARGTHLTWVIEHEGRASGCLSLDNLTWQLVAWRVDRAEMGFWLAPPLHGRGLMTEAAGAALRFAFGTLGLHKVTIGHLETNDASRRVIEKLGFRFVGRFADDVWRHGRWWSHLRYEMTRDEWKP